MVGEHFVKKYIPDTNVCQKNVTSQKYYLVLVEVLYQFHSQFFPLSLADWPPVLAIGFPSPSTGMGFASLNFKEQRQVIEILKDIIHP